MGCVDPDDPHSYKDAIFVSPHKMIGGPGTPGLLVARKELFTNRVPSVPGGGTVSFVNSAEHHYMSDTEHREEGGTPNIVGAIRCGMVFALKGGRRARRRSGRRRDRSSTERSRHGRPTRTSRSWGTPKRIGCRSCRLSSVTGNGASITISLLRCSTTSSASRAAEVARALVRTDIVCSESISRRAGSTEREIARGCEVIRPGWVRVNFNYFISEETFAFLLEAVNLIAEHGWRLVPRYTFDPKTAFWHYAGCDPKAALGTRRPVLHTRWTRSSEPETIGTRVRTGQLLGGGAPSSPRRNRVMRSPRFR